MNQFNLCRSYTQHGKRKEQLKRMCEPIYLHRYSQMHLITRSNINTIYQIDTHLKTDGHTTLVQKELHMHKEKKKSSEIWHKVGRKRKPTNHALTKKKKK